MSIGSGATRWWEGYLVRYLMPSIAGIVIVTWLASVAGEDFQKLLLLPQRVSDLNGPNLILLFLYANLFCYIASYPILSFHATRVLDFSVDRWPNHLWADGYVWTLMLGGAAFCVSLIAGGERAYYLAYGVVALFAAVQLLRLLWGLRTRATFEGLREPASPLFGYAYALARRRSVIEEVVTTRESVEENNVGTTPEAGRTRTSRWRPEFMDTYRHMREHGNSAYIFFLELSLAALVYALLAKPGQTGLVQLSAIGVLFALWAVPAVFVHLVGQHLERRFSQYDRRLGRAV